VVTAGLFTPELPTALAHAALVSTSPEDLCLIPGGASLPPDTPACRAGTILTEPPRSVRLIFSEAVQPIGRGLRVVGPDGRRVDRGPVTAAGPEVRVDVDAQSPGTYRAVWAVISEDTHPEIGAMAFSVLRAGGVTAEAGAGLPDAGAPAAAGTALGAIAHVLHFVGYALGFGTFTAWSLAGRSTPDAVWRMTGAGIVLLVLAEPVAFAAESVALGAVGGGYDPAVIGAVLDSSFGRVLAQRLAAPILLWVLVGALRTGALRAPWTVPLLGVGLAFVDGQAAHATGVRPAWWGLAVNAAHLAAMGLWAGALALILGSAAGTSRPAGVHRLAAVAGIAAIATGIVMAAQHLSGLADLVASPYGRTLAVKIGVVVAAAALGWAAIRRPAPRLFAWEAAAMLAILVLAGLLVLLRPPVP
jgi:copper transport protein